MYQATVFKVLIASPFDVTSERDSIRKAIADWNAAHSETQKMVLLPVGWDTDSTPELGDRPQGIINKQIGDSADLLVAIFWSRIGTPSGDAASGTIEEIERHAKAGKPVMIYFSNAEIALSAVDQDQLSALRAFKESCQSRALYHEYANVAEFDRAVRRHLAAMLNAPYFAQRVANVLTKEGGVHQRLSDDELHLLRFACDGNGVVQIRSNQGETVVTAGTKASNDVVKRTRDRRDVARWEHAVEQLLERGYIRKDKVEDGRWLVTAPGYRAFEDIRRQR